MKTRVAVLLVALAWPILSSVGQETANVQAAAQVAETGQAAASGEVIVKTRVATAADWFRKGGRTMYFLAFLSVMGLTFTLERLFNLRQSRIAPAGLAEKADRLWKEGKLDELRQLRAQDSSALAEIIAFIANHRGGAVADVSTGAGDIGSRHIRRHLQKAYPLAVVATLSPLLGLLGTVIGMIECFDVVAMAGALGDPTLLAEGISKALITTEAGLFIAIPALGVYHYFKSRASLFGTLLEEEASEMIGRWLMKKEV